MNIRWLVVCFFLITAAPFSHAEKGFYIGAVGGITSYKVEDRVEGLFDIVPNSLVAITGIDDGEGSAFGVFAGYDFNNFWGLEINYLDLGTVELLGAVATDSGEVGGYVSEIDVAGYSLVGVGRYPISDQFDIHFKLGAWHWDADAEVEAVVLDLGGPALFDSGSAKADETDVTFGVGFRYRFANNVELSADWNRYVLDNGDYEDNIGLTSLGIGYHF